MNKYELTVVLNVKLEDEERAAALEKVKGYITRFGGTVTNVDEWDVYKRQAQIYSRILKKYKVILVTTYLDHEMVRKANMIPASSPDEALEMAYEMMGRDASCLLYTSRGCYA